MISWKQEHRRNWSKESLIHMQPSSQQGYEQLKLFPRHWSDKEKKWVASDGTQISHRSSHQDKYASLQTRQHSYGVLTEAHTQIQFTNIWSSQVQKDCREPLIPITNSPDISYAVNRLSQFMHHPTTCHWLVVKRLLRYLSGTMNHGIFLRKQTKATLHGFSDIDWVGDSDDYVSTNGYIIYLGSHHISLASQKQKRVAARRRRPNTEQWRTCLRNCVGYVPFSWNSASCSPLHQPYTVTISLPHTYVRTLFSIPVWNTSLSTTTSCGDKFKTVCCVCLTSPRMINSQMVLQIPSPKLHFKISATRSLLLKSHHLEEVYKGIQ